MRIPLYLTMIMLLAMACNAQNSVATNEIRRTNNHYVGVFSKSGELLIDTVYRDIRVMNDKQRQSLPSKGNSRIKKPVEFYIVRNAENQYAIFDQEGKVIFDFVDCISLQFDAYTRTVVTIKKREDNRMRSTLYSLQGKPLFETDFRDIGYINDSDLIALVAKDGQQKEYYLFNPFTNIKLGPFTHFNIFNEDRETPMGMEDQDFGKYKKLNLITARITKDNDYIWGVIDMKGNEILPIEYDYFRIVADAMMSRGIEKADKPEGVDFLFYSRNSKSPNVLLLDEKMNVYEFDMSGDARTIRRLE